MLDAESHALSANKKKVFLSHEPIMTLVKNNMDLFLVVGSLLPLTYVSMPTDDSCSAMLSRIFSTAIQLFFTRVSGILAATREWKGRGQRAKTRFSSNIPLSFSICIKGIGRISLRHECKCDFAEYTDIFCPAPKGLNKNRRTDSQACLGRTGSS